MTFDKSDIYNEQIEPMILKIREICEQHGMAFTHTCTVGADNGATYAAKSVLGSMDPRTVDPYTRLNIVLQDIQPEIVEGLILRLIAEKAVLSYMYSRFGAEGEDKEVNMSEVNTDFEEWLSNELKDLDLNV